MNQQHKDLIRHNYMALTDELKAGVEDVCKELWRCKIISKHMEEDIIEGERTGRRRAQALLDLIVTRGPYAFDALYEAAKVNELPAVCDILKPQQSSHFETPRPDPSYQQTRSGYESDDELPDSWPSEEALNAADKVRFIQPTDDAALVTLYKKALSPDQDSYYPMRHKPRGRCLVINNEIFEKLDKRDGSFRDRRGLEKLFQDFSFDVEVQTNLTSAKMWQVLESEAKREDHQRADCFMLFILSHGHTGVVFGTDGRMENKQPVNCIQIKKIRDLFCGVPALTGKPKLFFIQACQGDQTDSGLPLGTTADDGTANKNDAQPEQAKFLKEIGPADSSDALGQKTGSQADVFVAMATTADYLSWRNMKYGTWFIQAVVYVFSKYAYKRDLNRLMTLVNKLVGKAETYKGKYKQVGEKTDTFQKLFFFFPGLYEEK